MIRNRFTISVEVVPPVGSGTKPILTALRAVSPLPFDAFSVATNPVAKPRMSALALSVLVQKETGIPTILHCTTRDHNRLALQGMLWGARALGIESILAATGDFVALEEQERTTTVRDLDVCGLVRMARTADMRTGVVFDFGGEFGDLEDAVLRLEKKAEAGAQFAVTQPVYSAKEAEVLIKQTGHIDVPIIMGILPLRTPRHAEFLHTRVSGITVPRRLRERMRQAADPVAEGNANAGEMLGVARTLFAGACIMPPFGHYEVLFDILAE